MVLPHPLTKKWPYSTSPPLWNDMTTSCVSGCSLFGIRFKMEMLAASAPRDMLGMASEMFVPWRNTMPAPLISPKSGYGSGGGEKSPLILNVAIAEMEVIGWFSDLFCSICDSSLAVSSRALAASLFKRAPSRSEILFAAWSPEIPLPIRQQRQTNQFSQSGVYERFLFEGIF
jgi:hypothetical protein